ncbi:BT_3987 domain-containing protein [Proteiniphilum sp. UBA5384]|uniref:BT_3987 domain-containing protein n=1 Tax=Proteiniphilum sp. UBA5384 TaxID=1947279 RepID=UPI0025E0AA63|nr:DUF1735 domain-containing protein [Proteiniphilum sp. UBA5384]
MKYRFLFLLWIFPLVWGCATDGDQVNVEVEPTIYIVKSGLQTMTLNELEEGYQLWVYKGGYDAQKSTVTIHVDEEALDSYNEENGTDFRLLPSFSYEMETSLTLDNENRTNYVKIKLNSSPTGVGDGYILPLSISCANPAWINEAKKTMLLQTIVPNELNIASYNIEYNNLNSAGGPWSSRKILVGRMFQQYDFDIVGVQEPDKEQLDDIRSAAPGYDYLGTGATGSVAVFYKRDRFEVIESDIFWLSPTPDIPGKGWDAYHPRKCRWVHFKDMNSDKEFYFFNIHMDHVGVEARMKSTELVLEKIPEIAGNYPAILTGDFNFNQNDANYNTLEHSGVLKDSYVIAPEHLNKEKGTHNAYNPAYTSTARIDHIFLYNASFLNVKTHEIITTTFEGKFPSDHCPVRVILEVK